MGVGSGERRVLVGSGEYQRYEYPVKRTAVVINGNMEESQEHPE
jgi:hypothetical protein